MRSPYPVRSWALRCWRDENLFHIGGAFVIWQTEECFIIIVSHSVVKEVFI